MTNILFYFY